MEDLLCAALSCALEAAEAVQPPPTTMAAVRVLRRLRPIGRECAASARDSGGAAEVDPRRAGPVDWNVVDGFPPAEAGARPRAAADDLPPATAAVSGTGRSDHADPADLSIHLATIHAICDYE